MTEHREDESFYSRAIHFSLSAATRHLGDTHASHRAREGRPARPATEDNNSSLLYFCRTSQDLSEALEVSKSTKLFTAEQI